ncbi:MAG: phosphoglucosamine mutase, partial [Chlorobiales bacterium]|nr:phosphoglucosamine mutase [Chlorobiales bacterium]
PGKADAAYGYAPKVVLGRDTRPTGKIISDLVQCVLVQAGCNVINIGVATTPTVEIAVTEEGADGGIIITASHNPVEWNALKLLNSKGEFLTAAEGVEMIALAEKHDLHSAVWNHYGMVVPNDSYDERHIEKVLCLPFVKPEEIAKKRYKVLVDAVEGAGSSIVPELCRRLGIAEVIEVACGGTGMFPHNPEPIESNLVETMARIKYEGCDFGIVVDPDVDRLALICEDGTLFGEEYTLVACADFYLKYKKGAVVNNLSSSRALRDVAGKHSVESFSGKVGEANVIEVMKEKHAVIGGEGNGGVILPEVHYGRDALVGIGLFVQAFCEWQTANGSGTLSEFKKTFPEYHMGKHKIKLPENGANVDEGFRRLAEKYSNEQITTIDGLKIDFSDSWAHMRKSNTEPIVRIYTEAKTRDDAEKLADRFSKELLSFLA